ncbi:tRNA (5-methylaminomethyl-2-thiouridine)(34)-methyltransferase MnmD [Prevotella sp. 10(H)]|uniref:tRNA (5-methylaminomethyl-2-thiouridine)(34)-methyltransferase MnmD n=1 Tax=Prevotella sp. 10(H) TaxID=1158294 RepID=UPI0004A6DCF5|nr:tRNA (5-methylaminomethyl-2-thiouridine)(34)-methyltransferase MnmD [Prevotella sp. 10(H)]
MSVKPVIELTADGSHTLFIPELDEHYHSVNGAVQESTHVFIEAGLKHCLKDKIHIFEVGFGTGLNAFLTLSATRNLSKKIYYTAIEAYPLAEAVISQLNYANSCNPQEKELYHKLHSADWNKEIEITDNFYLKKIQSDFTNFDFKKITDKIDLIYFDAFAPDKQPDMWTQEIFDKLYTVSADDCILVTYCAKGVVRRMMQHPGYSTERLPGPPGKREMLRAVKHT